MKKPRYVWVVICYQSADLDEFELFWSYKDAVAYCKDCLMGMDIDWQNEFKVEKKKVF